MNRLLFTVVVCLLVPTLPDLKAQDQEWEIDKLERQEEQDRIDLDSTLGHLRNRWEVKLTFGKWFFANAAESGTEELFTIPRMTNLWQLTGSWHFSEKLSADISIGFQIARDIPPPPDVFGILNGNDVTIEGGGGIFLPIDLGLKYYFTRNKFRPLVGIGVGATAANFRYTLAEGNITDGLTRTNRELDGSARFGKLYAGFDNRLSKSTNFSCTVFYYSSGAFAEPIGGYSHYRGLGVNTGLSIIF